MGSFFKPLKIRLIAACILAIALIAVLFMRFVDLRPEVSPDFFFGSNDPELIESANIHALFPSDEFLIISVAGRDIFSPRYYERLSSFSADIEKISGIQRLVSVASGPEDVKAASESPFWRPLLISADSSATLIIAFVETPSPPELIAEIEAAARIFNDGETFHVRLSGMPYIVEHIRRSLTSDLKIFSVVSLMIFAGILWIVFRSVPIVLGASLSGITAVFLTFLVLQGIGQPVGILTANLAIIVYVLVQSQVIYLTANWRNTTTADALESVKLALLETYRASFWCMVTTLLGFATLFNVAAEPLRQLGAGGIVGAIMALLCCYLFYPAFLLFSKRQRKVRNTPHNDGLTNLAGYFRLGIGISLILIALAATPGLFRLNTDPSLLSYFEEESDLYEGLAFVDKNGGSSPLNLVVGLKNGGRLDSDVGYEAMWRLHQALAKERDVGTIISLPALLAEANSHPLALLLPWREIVSLLSLGINDKVADNFLNEDRDQVLYILRMRETGREEPRNQVLSRLHETVKSAGFEPVLTGGIYMLQGRLSELVARSLFTGIGTLLILFGIIAWIVSRNWKVALTMTGTVALIPVTILGAAGWWAVPVDIISAPAVSVCFGIAVDALIHLALAFKRHGFPQKGLSSIAPALREQSMGIIASSGIIAIGFIIFSVSTFPPTVRFGTEIVFGAIFAGIAALTLFPSMLRLLLGYTRRT
ncbi:efflux RND transporter permease subunit [Sneathiella litorea]|uniref:MMPL family transporter n=1 Tax=Sneathiella litorea TaxID=2606216 RepID=A0A6L8W871_9PROT|nr:MMPL family transporter [Sneathiella litorea]MZR31321.1 MMPL family transporter [Sneathiella litorea]